MSEEERKRTGVIDLRCLDLCHGMLERVNGVRVHKVGTLCEAVLTC